MLLNRALKRFFSPPAYQQEAHNAYIALVAQARKPFLYEKMGVPDTLDGRFDAIALHLFMLIYALRGEGSPEALEFARITSEVFFSDMDRSLREMGSTDTGTGMRVKKMAQALYGRVQAYSDGLETGQLTAALQKNLYRGADVKPPHIEAVVTYVEKNVRALQAEGNTAAILSGKPLVFVD